jgi:hypothetical protein
MSLLALFMFALVVSSAGAGAEPDPSPDEPLDDYRDYDGEGHRWDEDRYRHYDDHDWRYYNRPTRDPNASYIPCRNPRATRDEWGDCHCSPDTPHGNPDDANGCWACEPDCHMQATCVSPGRCQCLEDYEGDGISRCDVIVPQLVALSPTTAYSDVGTWIHVSFIFAGRNWEWRRNSAACRFGSYIAAAVNVTDSTMECRAPPHHPDTVEVAISIDGTNWSKERFLFVYRTEFNVFSILPIVLMYVAVIVAMATVIWRLIGRNPGAAPMEEAKAFLTNRKKSRGVGLAKKKKRYGP